MKPPPFRYHAPTTVDEALELLAEHGEEAKALAGGQSLIPLLNFRLARPAVLVDLNGIEDLAGMSETRDGGLRIGSMVRQRDAERNATVAVRAPLIAEAMAHVAHPQIRNRGTIGGSVAHADPAAELPAVMLALGARMLIRSKARGERYVESDDFFTGVLSTALAPDELLTDIEIPAMPTGARATFLEVARRHGDFALLGVAAVIARDEGGHCSHVRLAYVNAGSTPIRARRAEAVLTGSDLEPEAVDNAIDVMLEEIDPPTDVHASSAYRRQLARVLTRRAVSLS